MCIRDSLYESKTKNYRLFQKVDWIPKRLGRGNKRRKNNKVIYYLPFYWRVPVPYNWVNINVPWLFQMSMFIPWHESISIWVYVSC